MNVVELIDSINPMTWVRAARFIRREDPDAVIFKYWLPFFAPSLGLMARLVKSRGTRILGIVHNALPHEQRPGDRGLSRFFLNACEGFVVMSEQVERDIEGLGLKNDIVRTGHPVYDHFSAPIGRNEARHRLGFANEARILLFFGFIRPYKGLHVLLESMAAVRERLPGVQLIVAGECYEKMARYQEIIQRHRLAEHIQLHTDYIPNEDVNVYFEAADLVVQPYLSATQSGVAQIAFHFERPLVVTDVGGLAETVPDGVAGLVVPPDDPDAIADAIVRFFEENLSEKLTRGVRAEKRKYSWERLAEAVESLM